MWFWLVNLPANKCVQIILWACAFVKNIAKLQILLWACASPSSIFVNLQWRHALLNFRKMSFLAYLKKLYKWFVKAIIQLGSRKISWFVGEPPQQPRPIIDYYLYYLVSESWFARIDLLLKHWRSISTQLRLRMKKQDLQHRKMRIRNRRITRNNPWARR